MYLCGFTLIVRGNLVNTILLFGLLIISGYVVGLMVKKVPLISGSGIPQVEGILMKKLKGSWLSVLINKFVGGLIAFRSWIIARKRRPFCSNGSQYR
ncbi:hypothetical protein Q5M85_01665 [Paraclostridium bifermentans]|nr:hypothetical protein [Paraclostridium bifermentans]